MAKRTPVRASKDKKIFRATYAKTKRVNRAQATGNGGIRF